MGIRVDEVGGLVSVQSDVFVSKRLRVNLGIGAPYVANDAFGGLLTFDVPPKGTISNVIFIDLDDEGIQKDLFLSNRIFTPTADNAPFDVTDDFVANVEGMVRIIDFFDLLNSQVGQATPAMAYNAPEGKLYGQLITRGADNIAAGSLPLIFLKIV